VRRERTNREFIAVENVMIWFQLQRLKPVFRTCDLRCSLKQVKEAVEPALNETTNVTDPDSARLPKSVALFPTEHLFRVEVGNIFGIRRVVDFRTAHLLAPEMVDQL
jgi:hypothetical protein